jgi:NADPH:quinone reductase-like Zn-dependent oxidoreductase
MSWQHVRISRFGGPEVLELAEEPTIPNPGTGEVRIKVLAAGTGFTDSFIRRGRYPDFKGPLPFTPGYELVGVVEKASSDVVSPREGHIVADLCVVGGYAQYAIRPARFLVPVPDGIDAAEAVCIPLAYLTAFQMLTRYRRLFPGETILVIGASGTVGTALLDLSRHFGLKAIGAQRRTSPQLSDLVPQQSTIGLVTSLLPCVNLRRDELAAPASMRHSMRSADHISTGRSPVSHRGASSSATAPRPWQSAAKT